MTLGEYLREVARRPYDGVFPCAIFAADWVVAQGHPDPFDWLRAMPLRDAVRERARAGGTVALAVLGMERAGVPRTGDSQPGDVAVIERETVEGDNRACAIYSDGRWVTLGARGIEAGPATALAIWRL